jgi:uncharacterized membrane protein
MPPLSELHPVIVHFVIALGVVGVLLRVISLFSFGQWARHGATALLLIAAAGGALAVKSGDAAHGPAERIPGAREAVQKHEHDGERARNVLGLVALLEVGALLMRKKAGAARGLMAASALVGLGAAYLIYEAGEHGGQLVYEYAGGVGTRTGNPDDVQRLLIAGLFHQARIARDSGRSDEAARLTAELKRQRPNDPTVALLSIESQLKDQNDAAGALAAVRTLDGPKDQAMFATRRGTLMADAYVALGQQDSARALLTQLLGQFPQSRGVKAALDKLK